MPSLAKIQTKKIAVNLFELISETELIDEVERELWLTNFDALAEHEQKELARILLDEAHEVEKENEAHFARVAEINAKGATRLKHFVADKKKILFRETSTRTNNEESSDDELEEELLAQLENFGERS